MRLKMVHIPKRKTMDFKTLLIGGIIAVATVQSGVANQTATLECDTDASHSPIVSETAAVADESERTNALDESRWTSGLTGTWKDADGNSYAQEFDPEKGTAALTGENAFAIDTPSTDATVTIEVNTTFCTLKREISDPGDDAQAALRIGSDNVFQVWTLVDNARCWLDVAADGVSPDTDEEIGYTVRMSFNYDTGKYSVKIKADGDTVFKRFAAKNGGGETEFALANSSATGISSIAFRGDTHFTSLLGWILETEGFALGDEITLADATLVLNAAKAEWLNARGTCEAVSAKVGQLTAGEFASAYLCNLDIMNDEADKSFKITSIDLAENAVTIRVQLVRVGAVQEEGKDAPVNGALKFYGSSLLADFTRSSMQPLDTEVTFQNADFAEGDTATATIDLDKDNAPSFFNARIVEKE